jgi:hypothetical protein
MPEKLCKSSEYLTIHHSKALITRLLSKRRNTLRMNVLRTEGDEMPPHRKLDRRRDDRCAGALRNRASNAACSFFDSDRAAVLNVRAWLVIGFMK